MFCGLLKLTWLSISVQRGNNVWKVNFSFSFHPINEAKKILAFQSLDTKECCIRKDNFLRFMFFESLNLTTFVFLAALGASISPCSLFCYQTFWILYFNYIQLWNMLIVWSEARCASAARRLWRQSTRFYLKAAGWPGWNNVSQRQQAHFLCL